MFKVNDKEFDMKCRLCTSSEEGQIQIFGLEGKRRNLYAKIKECLPVSVDSDDALPKTICLKCVNKLDDYHKFREECVLAGLSLQSSLKENQPQAFPLEPECCLQEVETTNNVVKTIQPEDTLKVGTESQSSNVLSRADSPTMKKLLQREGLGDLVITPVIPKQEADSKSSQSWQSVGKPSLDDYVLMQQDTFNVESSFFDNLENRSSRMIASEQIEFHTNQIGNPSEIDKDILLALRRKREILPPMWDVFEKSALSSGRENSDASNNKMAYAVTRRRYIISKGAFPCSLCKRCFRVNQGFDREGCEWKDICDADENSADFSNSKSSDYDEAGGSNASNKDVKFFSCHICCKVFPRRSSLKRHQRTHMDKKMFCCPLCQKGFNRKEHLSRHMISHSGGRPYNCDICEKPFTRKEHLFRHRLCHVNDAIQYMPDKSSTPEMPNQNSNDTSTDKNDQEIPVTDSSSVVGQDDDSSPNTSKPYVCELCSQGFARKEHLMRHQIRTHRTALDIRDELKPYNCNICCKNFTRKEHLVRHQKIHVRDFIIGAPRGVIPGTDVSVSPVLTNRASSSGGTVMKTEPLEGLIPLSNFPNLSVTPVVAKSDQNATWEPRNKEPSMSDQIEMQVNGQDDDVSVQSSVQENMDQTGISLSPDVDGGGTDGGESTSGVDATPEVSRPHPCQFCPDKSFTRRSHLVRHFKRFHSDKPLSLVLTGRRRATMQEKQEFERFVLNNGQYWCTICQKTFGRRYHLVRHKKLHGPNEVARPFHCSACNNSFSSHEYFQTHKCEANNDGIPLPVIQAEVNVAQESATVEEKVTVKKDEVKKVPAKRDKRKRSKCNYECVTCGKGFSKKKFLNRHTESHADLMEDSSQHCD